MNKNIVILEGGQPKILSNVSKLRTSEQGGGSCTWIPEEDMESELAKRKVGNKRITEDGVYNAESEDGLYGYSEVTVDTSRRIRPKRITENGEYHADDEDLRGYSDVIVSVPSDIHNTRKRITENGEYNAEDEGFTGYSTVTVAVPPGRTRSKRISENGTFKASDEELEGYSEVTVNVPNGRLKSKTIVANGEYTASEEDAYGYSQIRVNVPQEGRYKIKNITDNGDYNASDDECSGYSSVHVNVPQQGRTASKTITENGTYAASDDELIGFSQVNVRVPQVGKTAVKSITENGTYEAKNESLLGYSSVRVNVSNGKLISKTITENGTYQIADEDDRTAYGYNRINVRVPSQGQVKAKTIRENGTYTASDEGEGVIGFSAVTVNVEGGKLGSKSITENGTYMAADDNLYGFRSVSVRVPGSQGSADASGKPTTSGGIIPGGTGSAVIGRDTNGVIAGSGESGSNNEYAIGIDSGGNIVATLIPSSIKIITPPSKNSYVTGQIMDYSGIVVSLLKGDGDTFTNATYPNGHVPMQELVFPVTVADLSKITEQSAKLLDPSQLHFPQNNHIILCSPGGISAWPSAAVHGKGYVCNIEGSPIGVCVQRAGSNSFDLFLYSDVPFRVGKDWGTIDNLLQHPPVASSEASLYYFEGIGHKYYASVGSYEEIPPFSTNLFEPNRYDYTDFAKQIFNGVMTGGKQEIPVQWVSSFNGRTFEDKFQIEVTSSASGGGSGYSDDSGGSSSGGGTNF